MTQPRDFWARRRAAVALEAEAERDAAEAQVLAQEHAALEDMSEQEVLAALDLPDPDTLTQGDDFTVFMAKAVPEAIRRRALRTLWRSNPVLANVDMLVDYGEDFTDAATVVENLQTAYQVGKGMLKHVEEMARQAEELAAPRAEEVPAEETPADEMIDETPDEEALIAAVEQSEPPAHPETHVETRAQESEDTAIAPAPRRMKFRVEETV